MERRKLASILGAHGAGSDCRSLAIEEEQPERFMASFAKAVAGGGDIFLANPAWRSSERAASAGLLDAGASGHLGWLMIPSGGASGGLKFARHDGETIEAAVRGFCGHFDWERVNCVSVLPLHHVSGFMAWMRSALTGGRFVSCDWKEIEAARFPTGPVDDCCLSLVPTQLQRLLAVPQAVQWLRKFRIIFVGGGPAWDGLLDQAARLELPLSPSYGATETAAMVAALKPEQFLNGIRGCGKALPHARIEIVEGGAVRVAGESVFRGYYPDFETRRAWDTDDLGILDAAGNLSILGRRDDLIVTGGKKVKPCEVEDALRSSGEFEDVAVIGIPDGEWGRLVVACHPPAARAPDGRRVEAALLGLASFKHPKRYAVIAPWPRNAQGKIDRTELARLALAELNRDQPA